MDSFNLTELEKVEHECGELEVAASDLDKIADEAATEYSILKESQKDYLAELMTSVGLNAQLKVPSETERDRLARCTPEWKTFRQGLFAAQRKANSTAWEAKNAHVKAGNHQRKFEATQSGLAYKRAEIGRLSS